MDYEFYTTVKPDDGIRVEPLANHYVIIIDKQSAWILLFIAVVLMF